MILLDTHALVWLLSGHRRARRLPARARLFVSPVSLLEIRTLEEIGRFDVSRSGPLEDDTRFTIDDPSSMALFEAAVDLPWTRDPFDRLIVGHALMRGWKLATADSRIHEHLPANAIVEI
ncbi:MAG TPA: PIN domain-containing protein [Polyangia bacterium]|jgi:PIN domain nuclease of toxin-antitoxin system|nr:PIN domain-containing protein [Polyangia bacterium]